VEVCDDFKSDLSSMVSIKTPVQEGVSPSSGFRRPVKDTNSRIQSIKMTLRSLGCETIEEEELSRSSKSEEESKEPLAFRHPANIAMQHLFKKINRDDLNNRKKELSAHIDKELSESSEKSLDVEEGNHVFAKN
jgi:hypothetical protein